MGEDGDSADQELLLRTVGTDLGSLGATAVLSSWGPGASRRGFRALWSILGYLLRGVCLGSWVVIEGLEAWC